MSFPSPEHAAAARAAVEFVSTLDDAEAISVVGSCARRPDANDLDLSVLVADTSAGARVEAAFAAFAAESDVMAELAALGPFIEVDLGAITGEFGPGPRGWTSGPDDFEVAVGNEVAYSVPLWQRMAGSTSCGAAGCRSTATSSEQSGCRTPECTS